ncbi:triose-phosphate isomerase [Janibacter sp. G56]|uniref:triose-phosphate isomerase n=1 Tax=Janibacter sp. G56 TaxID=3418717 RepID=UPI003CFF66C5
MTASARPVWIGTSWKMTKTLAQARAFVDEVSASPVPAGVQPFFLPAHTALAASRAALPADSGYVLGAQNAHWEAEGAATGEVSMGMVADAGATIVEIGHSERRARFGETDETVSRKVEAALERGLTPLVCVGESAADREAGDTDAVVTGQARAALSRVAPERLGEVVLAYEPVWAIGEGGRPAEPAEVAGAMAALHDLTTASSPAGLRALLYGGGVTTGNAPALLRVAHTDGLFVGRAAWRAAGFLELIRLAAAHARTRLPRAGAGAPATRDEPVTNAHVPADGAEGPMNHTPVPIHPAGATHHPRPAFVPGVAR